MFTRMLATVAVLGGVFGICSPLAAQGRWNRKVEAISIEDVGGGRSRIHAYYSVRAEEPAAEIDLGTTLEILVNGTVISSQEFPVTAGPASSQGCNTIDCFAGSTCLCCEINGEPVCICDFWIAPADPEEANLRPKDEIMVILRPSPGALPEEDRSDDLLRVQYRGQPMFWNRRLTALDLTPTSGAPPDHFDVHVGWTMEAGYDGSPNLGTAIEVLVDGVSQGTFPAGPGDLNWAQCAGCTEQCAWSAEGEPAGACVSFGDFCGCAIVDPPGTTIPDIILPPDGRLKVKLVPVPGALPELPGFDEDDEEEATRCPADLDGNGLVDFGDILAILSSWGPCAGCPQDLDGDDEVGFSDILLVLGAWGPCEPV